MTHLHLSSTGENNFVTRPVGDGTFEVIQGNTGVVIACGAAEVAAKRVVNTINACPFIAKLVLRIQFEPFTKDCGSPSGAHNFFLVRPRGIHPGSGKKHIATPVQLINGQLYTSDNELEPTTWSLNGNLMEGPTTDPYAANLEWMPCPD